jgi:hypothetical protein
MLFISTMNQCGANPNNPRPTKNQKAAKIMFMVIRNQKTAGEACREVTPPNRSDSFPVATARQQKNTSITDAPMKSAANITTNHREPMTASQTINPSTASTPKTSVACHRLLRRKARFLTRMLPTSSSKVFKLGQKICFASVIFKLIS